MGSTRAGSPLPRTGDAAQARASPCAVGCHSDSSSTRARPAASKRSRYFFRPSPVSESSAASARDTSSSTASSAATTRSASNVRCAPASSSR